MNSSSRSLEVRGRRKVMRTMKRRACWGGLWRSMDSLFAAAAMAGGGERGRAGRKKTAARRRAGQRAFNWKRGVGGKSVDLGGGRVIKKKKEETVAAVD